MIILLRNGQQLGSTMIGVLERYAKSLNAYGGQLFLAGVSNNVIAQLEKTGAAGIIGQEHIFPADEKLVATLRYAYEQASTWLGEQQNP